MPVESQNLQTFNANDCEPDEKAAVRAEPPRRLEQTHNKIMTVHLKKQIHSWSKDSEEKRQHTISVNDSIGQSHSANH